VDTVGRTSVVFATLAFAIVLGGMPVSSTPESPQYAARIIVDSGNLPFSVVLLGEDSAYIARREARRAGTIRFPDLATGTYRVLVELPRGKRAERLLEISAYHASNKREVKLSIALEDFLIVPHCLAHELSLRVSAVCVEPEVTRMLRSSWSLVEQGSLSTAHAELRHAVTLDPDFHEGWINLGLVAESQNSLLEAVHFYTEALRQDSSCFVANTNLAAVLSKLGRYDEALHFGREAIRTHPESMFAHRNQATIYLGMKQYRKAIPHLKEVIRLNGDVTDNCRLQLAIAHAELQEYDAAIAVFEEWMRLFPRHPRFQTVEARSRNLL
jgi:tetratricopeptide (TPR) repeat protein